MRYWCCHYKTIAACLISILFPVWNLKWKRLLNYLFFSWCSMLKSLSQRFIEAIKVLITTWQIVLKFPATSAVKTSTEICDDLLPSMFIKYPSCNLGGWRIFLRSLHHILLTCSRCNYWINCKVGDKKKQVTYLFGIMFIYYSGIYVLLIYIIPSSFLFHFGFYPRPMKSKSCFIS